jgi:hypothetical protein
MHALFIGFEMVVGRAEKKASEKEIEDGHHQKVITSLYFMDLCR